MNAFFTSEQPKTLCMVLSKCMFGWTTFLYDWALSCREKLLGFHYAPLVANLILFCYERDFMMSLSDNKQSDIIKAFNIWVIF